jgi:hypothetical protein
MNNLIWQLRRFWTNQISSRIKPPQKWLFDALGRNRVDMDFIFETTLFEGIIHFWETEGGEQVIRSKYEEIEGPIPGKALKEENQEAFNHRRKVYSDIFNCYSWAKRRQIIWDSIYLNWNGTVQELCAEEDKLNAEDLYYMTEILKYRNHLRT